MKQLIIIGASGCGREVLQWVKDINLINKRWEVKGFLDDNPNALNDKKCTVDIINSVDHYEIQPYDEFICGIGDPLIREQLVYKLSLKGAVFTNIIHPSAIVADNVEMGTGNILYPFSILSDNSIVGNNCIINMHSSVAHDSVLGDYCTISAYCDITGNSHVGNKVFMGTGVKLIPGLNIGHEAYLCAGSVVMNRVKDKAKVFGNPAKRLTI